MEPIKFATLLLWLSLQSTNSLFSLNLLQRPRELSLNRNLNGSQKLLQLSLIELFSLKLLQSLLMLMSTFSLKISTSTLKLSMLTRKVVRLLSSLKFLLLTFRSRFNLFQSPLPTTSKFNLMPTTFRL